MINIKRIAKLTRDIKKVYGSREYQKIIIKAKEGLFLIDLRADIPTKGNHRISIDKPIPEYEINDFSDISIEDIFIVGDGKSTPSVIYGTLEDIEELKPYFNDNVLNFKELTNEELKGVINTCED